MVMVSWSIYIIWAKVFFAILGPGVDKLGG